MLPGMNRSMSASDYLLDYQDQSNQTKEATFEPASNQNSSLDVG
jgi:hypothetical protein